jgi:ADP-ribosylglycohydrolase
MIGAIAGDVIGSSWEGMGVKKKEFELFGATSRFTDDTVLTVAVADCLLHGRDYGSAYRDYFQHHARAGFGAFFAKWAMSHDPLPYGSYGNGAAMRVSPIGWAFETLDDVLAEARKSAAVTHDDPEGMRGAEAVAAAVFLARSDVTRNEMRRLLERRFGYDLSRPLDEIRPSYRFDLTAAGSVPEAIIAFLESRDWEDAVRNAVSLGGDADTQACIAGAIAEAYYGVPEEIVAGTRSRLNEHFRGIIDAFETRYGRGPIRRRSADESRATAGTHADARLSSRH